MILRGYQVELLDDVKKSFINHNHRVLAVSPCGSGKTIMFAWMCNQHLLTHPSGYVWFLVHRQELVEQTYNTFISNNIPVDRVLIGMVQTVSQHLDRYKTPSLIIFDEAHHSTANTWKRIIDTYPNINIIGLTATPCRNDGKPLGFIYDDMVIGPDADWLINHSYLSPYDYYAPNINLEDSKWEMKGSDYNQNTVAETLDKPIIYGDIYKYINPLNKTIIYAPNINYSVKLENALNQRFPQLNARHFDGNTLDSERKGIIQDFRDGKIRCLLNVDLIGEGFDVSDCDCVILLRPTMSTALYIQQACRCLRYQENKRAVIYDLVGNVFRHGMPSDIREWHLNKPIKIRNSNSVRDLIVRECKHCFRVYKGISQVCPYCGFNNGKTKKQLEEDNKRELEKIEAIQKKKERIEVGRARTMEELIRIGKERGYKNPVYWARMIINNRKNI